MFPQSSLPHEIYLVRFITLVWLTSDCTMRSLSNYIYLFIYIYINDRHAKLSVINKLNKKSKHDITNYMKNCHDEVTRERRSLIFFLLKYSNKIILFFFHIKKSKLTSIKIILIGREYYVSNISFWFLTRCLVSALKFDYILVARCRTYFGGNTSNIIFCLPKSSNSKLLIKDEKIPTISR